jgi:hypothetical protein
MYFIFDDVICIFMFEDVTHFLFIFDDVRDMFLFDDVTHVFIFEAA